MTRQIVLLDVDTGVDDALAILYAVAHPDLELAGLSCVTGNAALPQVVANTCAVLDAASADELPVASGADRPLVEPVHGSTSHGTNGIGDIELPPSTRPLDPAGAVAMLRHQTLAAPAPLTLVALAPPTNIGLLLRAHPDAAKRLERIIVLGGSLAGEAEFNLGQDPEAAEVVLHAGVSLTLYPIEVFRQVAVPEATALELTARSDSPGRLAGQLLQRRRSRDGTDGYAGLIGDAGALVLFTHPELFGVRQLTVDLGLVGAGRGRTSIYDQAESAHQAVPVVDVVVTVDAEQAASAFVETISRFVR